MDGTKYRAPRLRRNVVARERLVARIAAAIGDVALVKIVAPAGYGKTTLMAQAAAALVERLPDGVTLVLATRTRLGLPTRLACWSRRQRAICSDSHFPAFSATAARTSAVSAD